MADQQKVMVYRTAQLSMTLNYPIPNLNFKVTGYAKVQTLSMLETVRDRDS